MPIPAIKTVEFERPQMQAGTSCVANAWARVPATPSLAEKSALKERIKALLKEKQAVLVAHYYVDADLQDLAEETGGCVSDSLEMARFGRDHAAQTLVVAGVKFMGETAKILSPEKRILMPDLDAKRQRISLTMRLADEFGATSAAGGAQRSGGGSGGQQDRGASNRPGSSGRGAPQRSREPEPSGAMAAAFAKLKR